MLTWILSFQKQAPSFANELQPDPNQPRATFQKFKNSLF
jgi:hypothetical protein